MLEIAVVMAIFTALIALGLFMSMETLKGTIYRSEEATIVSLLQKARSRSMNNINQAQWGVCYVAPNYVLFKGTVCSSAAAVDTLAANAGVAAASDFAHTFPTVVFAQLSGTTAAATITVLQDSRSATITINNEGTIIW